VECRLEKITVHYTDWGQGFPIIFLHGFGPDHRMMTGCMEPIFRGHEDFRRIYIDLPGMGKTPGEN